MQPLSLFSNRKLLQKDVDLLLNEHTAAWNSKPAEAVASCKLSRTALHFVLLTIAVWAGSTSALAENKRSEQYLFHPDIAGGAESLPGDWPYVVALVRAGGDSFGDQFCAGTLIQSTWVLTAAHCVDGVAASQIDVRTGLHNLRLDAPAETIAPAQLIKHPGYSEPSFNNDIALIRLSRPSAQPVVTLYGGEDSLTDRISTTVGWGILSVLGPFPEALHEVDLPIVSNSLCNVGYPEDITAQMLCTGRAGGGKGSCVGDSGGPLMVDLRNRLVLAGIISWGGQCAAPGYYDVNSRISALRNFIDQNVSGVHYLSERINIVPFLQPLLLVDPE